MKILFYSDWPLALTYLHPLYETIKAREPQWELGFLGEGIHGLPGIALNDIDVSIYCDELSVAPRGKLNLCIFHGLASKAQDFSSTRRDTFAANNQVFCVPGPYYRELLLSLGTSEENILVSGVTKFEGMTRKVLYAPTHNPQLSAIPIVRDRIYEIPNVTVHLHQWIRTGTRLHHQEFLSYYPDHVDREDIADLIAESDVIIGDFGSIVLEAIGLGKQAIQVVNPQYEDWYIKFRKITWEEMARLPEVHLPAKYGKRVYSFEELKEALDTVSNIGTASEVIYNFIKASRQS